VICFRLFAQCARLAASLADCTAGNKRAIKTPMMAMTTNNSTRVKPCSRHAPRAVKAARERHRLLAAAADGIRSIPAT